MASTMTTTLTNEETELKGYKGIFGQYKTDLVWLNIITLTILNISFIYVLIFSEVRPMLLTYSWGVFMGIVAGVGVTAGVHRYYCHRSFKASIPLQIFLMLLYCTAGHNPIFHWVRDHRVHHKFSETDADPHNSNRGFFFSHMGWLFIRKHPEVHKKGKLVDMSDILNDPIVQFHDKHFIILRVILCFLLPTLLPVYGWGDTWTNAFASQCVARYCLLLHFTWSVNSFAHLYGSKPFDSTINPRENLIVSFFAMGEGWHNFHHAFPWDYRASEHGTMNLTLLVLNFFKKIGHVYDTREASPELIKKVMAKRGEKNNNNSYGHPPMIEYED